MFWANPETGLSKHIWGRAMGWLAMSTVDTLDFFPEEHTGRKYILDVIEKIADGIVRYQSESRVWYQILDMEGHEGNYKESSCSSMFVYFLKKAVSKGYLSDKYLLYADKGLEGIYKDFIQIDDEGLVHIHNVCLVAGLGPEKDLRRDGSYEYYISEPVVIDDNKAFGSLLAALVYYAMNETITY